MVNMVLWAASRARMVLALIVLSILAGGLAYIMLPKEGEPDIEIPAIVISLPFQGISAEDSEKLLIQPMENELSALDGLKSISSTAVDGYANVVLKFEFGWDKSKTIADIRDRMSKAEGQFPAGADNYSINEFNFSEFPILVITLSGDVPELTLLQLAKDLQDRIEGLEPVLRASLTGHRDQMVEVTIDPLKLEAYNVTAGELVNVVVKNNQLIPAGAVETHNSSYSVKIPASFNDTIDVYNLPVKTNGDRIVTIGDIADIRLTFEDAEGTARFNGTTTVALQIVKRKGFNLIDTATLIRDEVAKETALWPESLQAAVTVTASNDQSKQVESMVQQLEGSVLTAIALVMIVILSTLGIRPALLVGFAIPTSFLLCFALLAVMGITISNIVMFGLILAVGMLVDGAIVVVEYAQNRLEEGAEPMEAYTDAATRMFWPIISSTATTLCAFLPMLFWPGVPGQFMGMLPITLIFVLSASLVVALIYLPVLGGTTGGLIDVTANSIKRLSEHSLMTQGVVMIGAIVVAMVAIFLAPVILGLATARFAALDSSYILLNVIPNMFAAMSLYFLSAALYLTALLTVIIIVLAISGLILAGVSYLKHLFQRLFPEHTKAEKSKDERTFFGKIVQFIVGNPTMPVVSIITVAAAVSTVFIYYGANNKGIEFFVETEPEQAIVYVQARGNLSLEEKDELLSQAEAMIIDRLGIQSTFAFAGEGGESAPLDTIAQAQIELIPWEDRPTNNNQTKLLGFIPWTSNAQKAEFNGNLIISQLQEDLDTIPGIKTQILGSSSGPSSSKPLQLRIKGRNWEDLLNATNIARDKFDDVPGLMSQEDSLPLPGIDWQINVDVEKAGRYGANVTTVGAMVQLVTRGIFLDKMRVDSSDEEVDIRLRFPEKDRVLSTLDTLKVRTPGGLIPLSNFVTREPVAKLGMISRVDQTRIFTVKSAVISDATALYSENDSVKTHLGIARLAEDGESDFTLSGREYNFLDLEGGVSQKDVLDALENKTLKAIPMTPSERIERLTQWLNTNPLPTGLEWEWTGDQEDQAESQEFLLSAFIGALGLMFIILLAQFNSIYNSLLVLLAVILSTAGVLYGMIVMDQAFSIIMTGTGIVALAGIVVNNNIVLIDTYQEFSESMPRIEAIIKTAEARIRPVLLTTITTMAGLAPMMYGISLDFIGGGYTIDSPTAMWWKQLATAVVWGLGVATVLTLLITPAMLALRVWAVEGSYGLFIRVQTVKWSRDTFFKNK